MVCAVISSTDSLGVVVVVMVEVELLLMMI